MLTGWLKTRCPVNQAGSLGHTEWSRCAVGGCRTPFLRQAETSVTRGCPSPKEAWAVGAVIPGRGVSAVSRSVAFAVGQANYPHHVIKLVVPEPGPS